MPFDANADKIDPGNEADVVGDEAGSTGAAPRAAPYSIDVSSTGYAWAVFGSN